MGEPVPRSMSVVDASSVLPPLKTSLQVKSGARRKFSFPAALHSTLLGLHDPAREQEATAVASARRRFSNVSDAVSRKLSHTLVNLGQWRGSTVSTVSIREVSEQGRSLCAQYIRNRLKRSGLFSRKCGLQRLRSAANLPGGFVVSEVAPQLMHLGCELERMHPKLYASVCRQVCVTLTPEKTARSVISRVGHELFKGETNWGKVVALFCVAGGLACDCVRQGHTELLPGLLEGAETVVETEFGAWVAAQGGWQALLTHCGSDDSDGVCSVGLVIMLLLFMALVVFITFLVLRYWSALT
ncbi:hypothetical protein B566_EDAN014517 [Ephemera danica]|nr:hypothetical protein B566_EDAN014517 [Ephemera danica]